MSSTSRWTTLFRKFAFAWQGLAETANRSETACVVNISSRSPLGVAGLISPWNLPLYLLTFKIAPAIMSGGVSESGTLIGPDQSRYLNLESGVWRSDDPGLRG